MNPKKIMLIVLSVLLVVIVVMTGILISRIGTLFSGTGGSSTVSGGISSSGNPSETSASPASSGDSTAPSGTDSQPTDPATVPPTTEPTEPDHQHEYVVSDHISASCENYGYDILVCSICNRQEIDNFVDPYGHNYSVGQTTSPTCTEGGYTRYTCSRCGQTEDRNLKDALGHELVLLEAVTADCEHDGYELYECARCGETLLENEVAAFGHTDEIIGSTLAPTCTTDGFQLLHCTVCDSYRDHVIPASGHQFDEWYKDGGCLTRECIICGETETQLLQITGAQTADAVNGGVVWLISVGYEEYPNMLLYTVCDYLDNGTLAYEWSEDNCLTVTWTDADGLEQSCTRVMGDLEPILIQ